MIQSGRNRTMAQQYADTLADSSDKTSSPAISQEMQDQIKAKAGEAVDYVSAEAKKALADPQKYMQESQDSIAAYARAQPLKALAIAAGVAFVVGALSRTGK
jgi:ElaB/YqjD/DUF883 family membrane-anchored ribosome-binding protein